MKQVKTNDKGYADHQGLADLNGFSVLVIPLRSLVDGFYGNIRHVSFRVISHRSSKYEDVKLPGV
jgi:hypothetical protein